MKILPREEVEKLTGKKRCNAQARELNHMGIDYRKRSDGSVVVLDVDLPFSLSTPKEVCFTING